MHYMMLTNTILLFIVLQVYMSHILLYINLADKRENVIATVLK